MIEQEDEFEEDQPIPDFLDRHIGWVIGSTCLTAAMIVYLIAASRLGWWPYL